MKHILKSLLVPVLAIVALPLMTACDSDTDSNPTLQEPTEFVLNVPAYAANNTYDLANSTSINLTTSQPAYGFPVVTVYEVQVAIDKAEFAKSEESAQYTTLASVYNQANMNVDATELNNAVVNLYQKAHNGADPSGIVMPIYLRLRAHVDRTSAGYCYSNIVELPKVVVSYVATMPSTIYLAGESIHAGAEAKKMAPVYGFDGQWYAMVYLKANTSFTWGGDDESAPNGYKLTTTVTDEANAGITEGTNGGIQVAKTGWYTLLMKAEIANNTIVSNLTVYPGSAYVIGATAGGSWTDCDAAWQMTAPEDASGKWVSPAFTGSGELRAYIHVPGIDWWRTEFTIYKGSLYWRTVNIPNNWSDDVGSDYSVAATTGQKLYVDFDYDKAEVK